MTFRILISVTSDTSGVCRRAFKQSLECLNVDDQCELLCLNLDVAEDLRGRAKSTDAFGSAAKLHSALSDELRLAMLASLTEHEICGCDLAWIHERSQSLVSHHMKMLVEAGLVTSRRDGRIVFFSLTETGKNHASALTEQAQV